MGGRSTTCKAMASWHSSRSSRSVSKQSAFGRGKLTAVTLTRSGLDRHHTVLTAWKGAVHVR